MGYHYTKTMRVDCQHLKLVGARVCVQSVPEPQDRLD